METISAGIFIFNRKNELLICHPTGGPMYKNWSIPKGKIDLGETALIGALRETYEESNVYLYDDIKNIKEIGIQPYNSKKSNKAIVGFVYKFKEDVPFELKCTLLIPQTDKKGKPKWNAGKPEHDTIKFMEPARAIKLLHEAQQKLILNYLKIQKNKFKINLK